MRDLGAKGSMGSKGEMGRHTLTSLFPHWQFSSGTPTDLYRHTTTAGCLHSCPYIYDKRETGKMEKAPKKHPTVPSHKPHGS